MGKLRLRVYPVFPRRTVAKRQSQDLNLDLHDEFPGRWGESGLEWGHDGDFVSPHYRWCPPLHVGVALRGAGGTLTPSPSAPIGSVITKRAAPLLWEKAPAGAASGPGWCRASARSRVPS